MKKTCLSQMKPETKGDDPKHLESLSVELHVSDDDGAKDLTSNSEQTEKVKPNQLQSLSDEVKD